MRIYEHKQGSQLFWAILSGAVVVAAILVAARQPGGLLGASLILAVTALIAILFRSLTVRVTEEEVAFWFGPGLIRKRYDVRDIAEARPVRNRWWYGWGIHLTPYGWLYNVAGLDAVQIRLHDGRQLRVGSDEPERLVSAIRQALERKR